MEWQDKFPIENRYFKSNHGILYNANILDVLKHFPDESIDTVITSPPYWSLRDYNIEGQVGLEPNFEDYLNKLWSIFDEIYRILKPTGSVWINLGDTYNNTTNGGKLASNKSKLCSGRGRNPKLDNSTFVKRKKQKYQSKSLLMIPERFAIGMIERGWILRNQIIWWKRNAMPSSAKDRFTVDFEKIFFFVKQKKYYFNQIKEPNQDTYHGKRGKNINRTKLQSAMQTQGIQDYYGKGRNKRTVWDIPTKAYKGAHFAVFPEQIPEICITAGCPKNGIALDPFTGSGTTLAVADRLVCNWIGIELNSDYCALAKDRINQKGE